MKHAKVIGWYGNSNIGDESYKLSFAQLFPDIQFDFANYAPHDNCILGGGNILDSGYVNALLATPAKRRMVFSVSAHTQTPIAKLRDIDFIWVRDQASYNLLQSNHIPCVWMPDASVCLKPDPQAGRAWLAQQFASAQLELYQKRIGVVVNGHLYAGNPDLLARDFITLTKIVYDLSKLADSTSASFIFFPMCTQLPHDDRVTNFMIAARCKFWRKNLMVTQPLTVTETINLISACDTIISTRLHSTIFSMVAEVPFIDLVHHDKNRHYVASLGLSEWSLPYWSLSYETLRDLIQDRLSHKEQYAQLLATAHQQQLATLRKEAKNVHFI